MVPTTFLFLFLSVAASSHGLAPPSVCAVPSEDLLVLLLRFAADDLFVSESASSHGLAPRPSLRAVAGDDLLAAVRFAADDLLATRSVLAALVLAVLATPADFTADVDVDDELSLSLEVDSPGADFCVKDFDEAEGDVLGAEGDVLGAEGDVLGAEGDVLGTAGELGIPSPFTIWAPFSPFPVL